MKKKKKKEERSPRGQTMRLVLFGPIFVVGDGGCMLMDGGGGGWTC